MLRDSHKNDVYILWAHYLNVYRETPWQRHLYYSKQCYASHLYFILSRADALERTIE